MAQWTSKEWCFTINYNDDESIEDSAVTDELIDLGSDEEELAILQLSVVYARLMGLEVPYIVCKGEIGKTGNYHLQGFVMFDRPMTMKSVKELFQCSWVHLEKRSPKSTAFKAAAYCKKPETAWVLRLFEIGELKTPCATKDEAIARTRATFIAEYDEHFAHREKAANCAFCDIPDL